MCLRRPLEPNALLPSPSMGEHTQMLTTQRSRPTYLLGELVVWWVSICSLVLLILPHGEESGSTLQHRHATAQL